LAKKITNKMQVLGLMSGTSLDGLDMALCEFEAINNQHSFKIKYAKTVTYSSAWKEALSKSNRLSAKSYFKLHALFAKYMAGHVKLFLNTIAIKPNVIASHGHTVFHQPQQGFSTQLGCGATLAANTGITTVCDFRSLDVANGGQGAPLVPIGDKLLFGHYAACLNIGGIANISFDDAKGNRIAYDVCEANMLLNYLAEKLGQAFDRDGALAKAGHVDTELLTQLNALTYYSQIGAKSMGREWFEQTILPLIENKNISPKDALATATEHIAHIIAHSLKERKNVLFTGGGTFNSFLVERIKSKTLCEIVIPNDELINFKEALIFAFLGYLRINEKINTLNSVTDAKSNSVGGAVYLIDLLRKS
jgi:anhydro-N-acetylmuramic acid kinase